MTGKTGRAAVARAEEVDGTLSDEWDTGALADELAGGASASAAAREPARCRGRI